MCDYGIVYRIVNVVNSKVYYGSTVDVCKRWKRHVYDLDNNIHHNVYLQRSWNKHGKENFIFEIVEKDIPKDDLHLVEQSFIDLNLGGYNLGVAGGGDNLSNHPNKKHIIEKRSKSHKIYLDNLSEQERKNKYGKKGENNPRYIDGRSNGKKCKTCDNVVSFYLESGICGTCRDRTGNNNPFYGKTHSQETKNKLSVANSGRIMSSEAKESITGKNSGRYIGEYHTPWGVFSSSSQAEKANPLMKSAAIHRICLNPDNTIQKIGKSKFLFDYGPACIGKTYRDIGFWFEPKLP